MEPSEEKRSPFPWVCSRCGADIDAPDQVFEFANSALVPGAAYTLLEIRCLTCSHVSDAAVWVVDRREFVKETQGDSDPEAIGEPGQLALLDRYLVLQEALIVFAIENSSPQLQSVLHAL